MDTTTVLQILAMIEDQQEDINALFEDRRPRELRDSGWIFSGDYVKYGANKALDMLRYHLEEFIDSQLNAAENATTE